MASVDYEKLHTANDVKRRLRHCDKKMRMQDNHDNEHIQRNLTSRNMQLVDRDYKDTCKLYDDILAHHDSMPNANRRKDRVTCFGLTIPIPDAVADDAGFALGVYDIICDQYGVQNILQMYTHVDEVHEYVDATTHDTRNSLRHIHCYVVPINDQGKLCGKDFSSKKNMMTINKSIDDMCVREYGCHFVNGSKQKSRDSVEHLKLLSQQKQIQQQQQQLQEQQQQIQQQQIRIKQQQEAIQRGKAEYKQLQEQASELRECIPIAKQIRYNQRVAQAKQYNSDITNDNSITKDNPDD